MSKQKINSRDYVAASRVAALFGKHPYYTEWMLYQRHANDVKMETAEDERMFWGKKLQRPVLEVLRDQYHLNVVERDDVLMVDDEAPLLARFDAEIIDPTRGKGTVEVKCVDWMEFKDKWDEHKQIAPLHTELQLQVGMMVSGSRWGLIAALVGGNHLVVFERDPNVEVQAECRKAATEFMARVARREEPDPFGVAKELELMKQLYPEPDPEKVITFEGDDATNVGEEIRMLKDAQDKQLFYKKAVDKHKVAIRHRAQNGEGTILVPGWRCKINGGRFTPKEL